MPTLSYKEHAVTQHKVALAQWESLAEEEKKLATKPELKIPPDLEGVSITFPDRWLVGHDRQFWENYNYKADPTKVIHKHGLFAGCIAVCSDLQGVPKTPDEWPLELYDWLIDEVYEKSFKQARPTLKNLL